jgi:hypothetical protein
VECREARELLRSGRREQCESHLKQCEACALLADDPALLAALDRFDSNVYEDGQLDAERGWQRLSDSLQDEKRWTRWLRNKSTATRLLAIISLCAFGVASVLILRPRPDLAVYPMGRLLMLSALFSLVLLGNLWVAYRPLHRPPLAPWVAPAITIIAIVVTWIPVLLGPAHSNHPASLEGAGEDFAARAFICFAWGIVISLPLMMALWFGSRGKRTLGQLSPSVWVTSGIFAVLALQVHCPIVHSGHLVAGHCTVLLAMLVLAVLIRRYSR